MQVEEKDHHTPFTSEFRDGGEIKDISGYGNHVKLNSIDSPSWTANSKIGIGACKFDGSNKIIASKLFYENTNQCHTISAWVYPTNASVGNQQLINFNMGYRLYHTANGRSLMYNNGGVNDHYVYGSIISENKWTLVTWVYDKLNIICKVYYNGVLNSVSSNFSETDLPSGFSATTVIGQNFHGYIDDIRIYATALSDVDIEEIYKTRFNLDNNSALTVDTISEVRSYYKNDLENSESIGEFTIYSKGYPTDSQNPIAGVYLNGTLAYQYSRDWHISVWSPSIGKWATNIDFCGATTVLNNAHARYDTYGNKAEQSLAFINTLKGISDEYIVFIGGSHAPEGYTQSMADEIVRFGGSRDKLKWTSRESYICVGRANLGEGNAIEEVLSNLKSSDNGGSSWAKASFSLYKESIKFNNKGIALMSEIREVGLPIRYIRETMNGSNVNPDSHWVEIQAFNSNDKNVALGKSANSPLLTDGNIETVPYYHGSSFAQVDLGSVHTINYLKIWHYYGDARTYNDIATEVSADGVNWIRVFDSNIDGECVETSKGNTIICKPQKMSIGIDGNLYVREVREMIV